MSILVVGSVALDNLETPHGKRDNVLGGAATHFSAAASFFSDVYVVGVVGHDFDDAHIEFMNAKGIDLSGLKLVPDGKTFSWTGKYFEDINKRETLDTQLGVFETFDPELTSEHKNLPFVFLANIHPQLQLKVLDQMQGPRLTAMDTMNLWIDTTRDDLQKVIERVNMIFINDEEALQLTGESNVSKAAEKVRSWGPSVVVIKRGEHGALLFTKDSTFYAPAMPLATVIDPTGAGDTFAGGFLGYLARTGDLSNAGLRRAAILGSVMASYQVEDFGLDRLRTLKSDEIDDRFEGFKRLAYFEHTPVF